MTAGPAAAPPLLETKLYLPRRRSELVARPRLLNRLHKGTAARLVLVSAPPGFGKTTLLAEWLTNDDRHTGWVSLDERDNEPATFWSYVLTALGTERSKGAAIRLRTADSPIEPILITLINDIAESGVPRALVLDDYHVITNPEIHSAVTFLLENLPAPMQLVISSRADPSLPLARLRVRGELVEIRAADLRFTPDEAAAFLRDVMGLELSAETIAALEQRTEGWIAGLQLAALSMHGRDDVSGFVSAFTGDARYIVDYLLEEVLQRQPDDLRDFLLQTSILERLSGPLCDAVTGRFDSSRTLAHLEAANLFVIPLDDRRQWYRYHHLFADVLRSRLADESPALPAALHGRASVWFEAAHEPEEAIRHAFAAGDHERAATLVELTAPALRRARREATLLSYLKAIPDDVLANRPVLLALMGGTMLSNNQFDGAEAYFERAERWLEEYTESAASTGSPPPAMIVDDHAEFRRLPACIAVHRAGMALISGQIPETMDYARRALDLTGDDPLYGGAASALLGLSHWRLAELDQAFESFAHGMALLRAAGNLSDAVGGVHTLADIRITQGRLHDAMQIYQQALDLGMLSGPFPLRGTADMHAGMADLFREWNDLDAAERALHASSELGEALGFPQHPYRRRIIESNLSAATGDLDTALRLLTEAKRVYTHDFFPDVQPIAARKARIRIRMGRLTEVREWASGAGMSLDAEPDYFREYEQITFARYMLACSRTERDPALLPGLLPLLDRILDCAQAGGRTGVAIEVLALQALARAAAGDFPGGVSSLQCALALAEPQGYVRIFIDEGQPMADLLRRLPDVPYARQVLSAMTTPDPTPAAPLQHDLPEPLTRREIEIVQLIASGLRNEEIADRLFISLATVKRHIANAYGKMGATHRVEAVTRARELGLF